MNIAIAGQTWTGTANDMPIYRDQYFSAYSGQRRFPALPNPAPAHHRLHAQLRRGRHGQLRRLLRGRTGQRAGMMYNLGGNQGAVAFGRGPGG